MNSIASQYREINKFLSYFSILQHNNSGTVISSQNNTFLIRDIQISNQNGKQNNEELNQIINTLSQHQTLKSKNILSLIDFDIIFNNNKTQSQIRAVYNYGRKTLAKEIQDRKQSEEYFDEDALWGLLYSIASALAYLEQKSIIYGVIDASRVYLDNNLISILDPSSTGIDPYEVAANQIYSPQILKSQGRGQQIDMFKSDVFALGLLMLQSALLKMQLYEYDQNILRICLSEIRDLYSENFCQVMGSMLDLQPQSRPSFDQILKTISSLFQISNSEIQTLECMKPDPQNENNQICIVDEFNEKQNIDILQTEYIRLDEYQQSIDDIRNIHHHLHQSDNSQLSDSAINQSQDLSEPSFHSMDPFNTKSIEKSSRSFNSKDINQKILDYNLPSNLQKNTHPNRISITDQTNFHKRAKTQNQTLKQSKEQPQHQQFHIRSQKQNKSHQNNVCSNLGFSPLNKQNLFTKPQILSMIQHDIKRIQQRKKNFSNVKFSYLPENQQRNPIQFKYKPKQQKIIKNNLIGGQVLKNSIRK